MPIEQAPYDKQGNLLHFTYASPTDDNDAVDWRDNEPFEAVLTLQGAQRGRSSAYLVWADEQGCEYPMFIRDLTDLLRERGVRKGGKVSARWHAVKRGLNHGVALAPARPSGAGGRGGGG